MAFKWKCDDCGCEILETKEQLFSDGSIHIRAECSNCKKYLGFVPQEKGLGEFLVKFGKYKGKTMANIFQKDPGYIYWASKNIKNEKLKLRFSSYLDEIDAQKNLDKK